MISICVGIKNRTESLTQNLIASMNECENKDELELSVFDCGSDDNPSRRDPLWVYLSDFWGGPLQYTRVEGEFTRAHSLNGAVKQTDADWLFLCDADMTLPVDFVQKFHENVSENKVWFPICFSLGHGRPREISSNNGWWRESGFGMVGIFRKYFLEIGGYNEPGYKRWGGEDNYLHNQVKVEKVRTRCEGLFHNWHESPMNQWTTPPRFQ